MQRKIIALLCALELMLAVAGTSAANEGNWNGCPGHSVPGGGQQSCGFPGH